jgi:hypothetical protein
MNAYLFTGSHPQFVTINGAEFEMQPNNTVDLPDCDYVQTLVANGYLTPVEAQAELPTEAPAEEHIEAHVEVPAEAQTESPDVEAQAKKSAKKGAQE